MKTTLAGISILILLVTLVAAGLQNLGLECLGALLASAAIACFALHLMPGARTRVIPPQLVFYPLVGFGAQFSTAHLVFAERMAGLDPLVVTPSAVSRIVFSALALVLLGIAGFAFGLSISFQRQVRRVPKSECPREAWLVSIIALSILGLYATFDFVQANGGVSAIVSGWHDRDELNGSLRLLIPAMPLASLLWIAGAGKRLSWPTVTHLLASFVCLTLIGNRSDGIRLLAAAVVLGWACRQTRLFLQKHRTLLLLGVFALVLVYFVTIGAIRGVGKHYRTSDVAFSTEVVKEVLSKSTADQMLSFYYLPSVKAISQVLAIFPERLPFLKGLSFGSALDVWVPISLDGLFPTVRVGKMIFVQVYDREADSALFATLIGEFYLNWGIAGVPVGMVALGFLCSRLYRRAALRPDDPWISTAYALFLAVFLPYLLTVESLHASHYSFVYFYLLAASFILSRLLRGLKMQDGPRRSAVHLVRIP
ncbi:MAG: hypothetical protein ACE15E_05070 [Acidobacteriota bacterium]